MPQFARVANGPESGTGMRDAPVLDLAVQGDEQVTTPRVTGAHVASAAQDGLDEWKVVGNRVAGHCQGLQVNLNLGGVPLKHPLELLELPRLSRLHDAPSRGLPVIRNQTK